MSQGVPQVGDDGNGVPVHPGVYVDELKMETLDVQATLKAAEPTVESALVVSELDRVKAENLHLRLLISAYKVKDAQQEMGRFVEEQRSIQTQIAQAQADLQEKYGIDLTTHEIRSEDGVVVPRGQNRVDFGQLMQRIANQA